MNKRINNKGFSLVELIVAVLILGIVSGGAIMGFSVVYNARVSAASKIVMSQMKKARSTAMSLENSNINTDGTTAVYLELLVKNNDVYADIYSSDGTSSKLLSSEKVSNDKIKYTLCNHVSTMATPLVIGDGSSNYDIVRIYYKKGTGGISVIYSYKADGTHESSQSPLAFDELNLEGSTDSEKIILVSVTGRSYLDK